MKNKGRNTLICFIYIMIIIFNLYLVSNKLVLNHHWKFDLDESILYLGSTVINEQQLSILFVIFYASTVLSILHIANSLESRFKNYFIVLAIIYCGLIYIEPLILTYTIVGLLKLFHDIIRSNFRTSRLVIVTILGILFGTLYMILAQKISIKIKDHIIEQ